MFEFWKQNTPIFQWLGTFFHVHLLAKFKIDDFNQCIHLHRSCDLVSLSVSDSNSHMIHIECRKIAISFQQGVKDGESYRLEISQTRYPSNFRKIKSFNCTTDTNQNCQNCIYSIISVMYTIFSLTVNQITGVAVQCAPDFNSKCY